MRIPPGRSVLVLDLAIKTTFAGVLAAALLWPHLPQFDGEKMEWRALTYPIGLLAVPAGWSIFRRVRAGKYPYVVDMLLMWPLLVDAAAPRLYHTVDWWDKFMHVMSWSVLCAVSVLLLSRFRLDRAMIALLAIGIGLVTAVLWELAEYLVWVQHSPDLLKNAYSDTRGDLACDIAASVLGVSLTLALTRRRNAANVEPDGRLNCGGSSIQLLAR